MLPPRSESDASIHGESSMLLSDSSEDATRFPPIGTPLDTSTPEVSSTLPAFQPQSLPAPPSKRKPAYGTSGSSSTVQFASFHRNARRGRKRKKKFIREENEEEEEEEVVMLLPDGEKVVSVDNNSVPKRCIKGDAIASMDRHCKSIISTATPNPAWEEQSSVSVVNIPSGTATVCSQQPEPNQLSSSGAAAADPLEDIVMNHSDGDVSSASSVPATLHQLMEPSPPVNVVPEHAQDTGIRQKPQAKFTNGVS